MKAYPAAFHILRVGMAVTFLWVGLLILKSPEAWGGYLQPWAMGLLPVPVGQLMIGTAIFDLAVGFLLLVNVRTWVVSLLAAFHLAVVMIVSGINAVTVRDIGLFAAALALFIEDVPPSWQKRLIKA
ncbi:DoxX family membrane protein [Candidatus Uhrbacteria bacterium]|nr:MAG: DoxX family membrane protein [Candidatus Uhrbacteria bacterium]